MSINKEDIVDFIGANAEYNQEINELINILINKSDSDRDKVLETLDKLKTKINMNDQGMKLIISELIQKNTEVTEKVTFLNSLLLKLDFLGKLQSALIASVVFLVLSQFLITLFFVDNNYIKENCKTEKICKGLLK